MNNQWLTAYTATPQTMEILTEGGWFLERFFDAQAHIEALEAHGFLMTSCIRQTIHCFGGLKLDYPLFSQSSQGSEIRISSIWIEPTEPLLYYSDGIEDFEAYLGERLCYIGTFNNKHIKILANGAGEIYAGVDQGFTRMGDTLLEAIDQLVLNKVKVQTAF